MKLAELKEQIQSTWKTTPVGWQLQVQNVYLCQYQLRQNKKRKTDDRPQHWRQYLKKRKTDK